MRKFLRDDEGQGFAEYALILAFVAVVVIGAITALGDGIDAKLQEVADELE